MLNKGSSLKRHTLLGKKELPLTSTTALLVRPRSPPDPAGSPDAEALVGGVLGHTLYRGYFNGREKGAAAEEGASLPGWSPLDPKFPCPTASAHPFPGVLEPGPGGSSQITHPEAACPGAQPGSSLRHCSILRQTPRREACWVLVLPAAPMGLREDPTPGLSGLWAALSPPRLLR